MICGLAVYQYEHFDPPYEDASAHSSEGITLLCGSHHDKRTRGLLSSETVAEANANPWSKREGHSYDVFDTGPMPPSIVLGSVEFKCRDYAVALETHGSPHVLLGARAPEEVGGPFRLSAMLCNENGSEILRIRDNEWSVFASSWDVEVVGRKITIRNGPGDVALRLRAESRDQLVVEHLRMFYKGVRVTCDEERGILLSDGNSVHDLGSGFAGLTLVNDSGGGLLISSGTSSVVRQNPALCDGGPAIIW